MTSATNGVAGAGGSVDFYEQDNQTSSIQSNEELLASNSALVGHNINTANGSTTGASKIPTNWYMSAAAAAAAVAANTLPVNLPNTASFLYSNDESLSNNSYNFQHKF
jgi:hypothetical protein